MSTTNPWLNPLQRSYNQIRSKLIDSLKLKVPELTDFSEGNIFMLVLSIFSSMVEVLHYYIDSMASETFFVTSKKYSSLKKHAKLVDYHVRSANPSQVDILVSLSNGTTLLEDIEIPAGINFYSLDGKPFISNKKVTWKKGSYAVVIPVTQQSLRSDINFGINSSDDIVIYLGDLGEGLLYAEGSMSLSLTKGGVTDQWVLVDTFAYSKPTSKHYMVELDDNYLPFIKFGNGVYGEKPPVNSTINGSFYVTNGNEGNVAKGRIISVPAEITNLVNLPVTCINQLDSVGGSDYENFSMVKEHLPLSIKTLGVAISKDDYEAIAKLSPSVDKAFVNYKCGKFLDIYITPDGGGIASSGLCESTYAFILKRKVITTSIKVYPTRESLIFIDAEVTGKPSFKRNDINLQIVDALFFAYSYNTSDIAKPVRLSDLYSLIDGLSMVDFLKINNLYLLPLFNKVGVTSIDVNAKTVITSVINPKDYYLRYSTVGDNCHLLYSNSVDTGIVLEMGVPQVISLDGNVWQLTVNTNPVGPYTSGDLWSFSLPVNKVDQIPSNFTIPVFSELSQVVLNITEVV